MKNQTSSDRVLHAPAATSGAAQGLPRKPDSALSRVAEEAYVYGYPLMLMDLTARTATNVEAPSLFRAPFNQFAVVDQLPDANFNFVVLPNVDTLYTSAMLDLSEQPIVLHVPDTQGRYYLMPMLSAHTDVFASPGARTTGTGELTVAIVGPQFGGAVPASMQRIAAPSNLVWLLGRTQINGAADLEAVRALTERYTLTPLSRYGAGYIPPRNEAIDRDIDMKTPPPDVLARLSDHEYFTRLASLLAKYPPPAQDQAALKRFAALGLAPGRFEPPAQARHALDGASKRALQRILGHTASIGERKNGWNIDLRAGAYGTNYLDRATIARCALGANLPEDAIYPSTAVDADGQPLDSSGDNRYVIHFEAGQEPPARAFWSLTLYNSAGYLVDNELDRYAIGSRDDLKRNPDGSLDLFIQREKPEAERVSQWLPAPVGTFQLLLRVYWPRAELVEGRWRPPAVRLISD